MSTIPLVLIHHAGGSAAVFQPLLRALPADCQVRAVELPGHGRQWRLEPEVAVDDAITRLVEATDGITGDFGIFGHSLGAYLGLALAARLERTVGPARCAVLFASANAAPSEARLPFEGSPLGVTDEEIFEITRRAGGGVSRQLIANEKLRTRTANLLRADFAISSTFLGARRHTVTEADIVACYGSADIFTEGQIKAWERHTTGEFESHAFAGEHFYLADESEPLAKLVAQALSRAR